MNIADILEESAIKIIVEASEKKRLFQEISVVMSLSYGIDASECNVALNKREELGPTAVGNGIALPHARISDLTRVCGVFFKLMHPLPFGAVDAQNVDLIFGLIAPEGAGVDHLKSLALVSRRLRNVRLREQLRANNNPSALYSLLTGNDGIDGTQEVVNA